MPAKKDTPFSFEEQKISDWISRAQQDIARKEKQIEYLKRMSGNLPELRPPYHGHGHTPGYAHRAQRLRGQIDAIKTGTIDRTATLLKYASSENRQKGNGMLVAFLYRDETAQGELKKPKEINRSQAMAMKLRYGRKTNNAMDEKKTEKNLDASQEYAAKLMGDYREQTPEGQKSGVKNLDASQDYAMKLRYGAEDNDRDKGAEQEKGAKKDIDASQDYARKLTEGDREQPQPQEERADRGTASKSMSMSASFSQRLDQTVSVEQDEAGREGMDKEH